MGSRASQSPDGFHKGLGHHGLSPVGATQQGQSEASAPGTKSDTDGKMAKMLSFCPFCLYNGSNDILYMNHIMGRHYGTAYGCGNCLKEVFPLGQQLKAHLRVCMGFPRGSTPSSSNKEPVPQGAQESSQDSPHHSQCLKKKSDSTKESISHSKVLKSHKKSKHQKEGTPKKEKWDKDKADKHKSKKSHKK